MQCVHLCQSQSCYITDHFYKYNISAVVLTIAFPCVTAEEALEDIEIVKESSGSNDSEFMEDEAFNWSSSEQIGANDSSKHRDSK